MIRPPPRSTLFPYTTLSDLMPLHGEAAPLGEREAVRVVVGENRLERLERSEEHTSELQSHSDLVCRLLLEKKKSRSTTSLTVSWAGSRGFTLSLWSGSSSTL